MSQLNCLHCIRFTKQCICCCICMLGSGLLDNILPPAFRCSNSKIFQLPPSLSQAIFQFANLNPAHHCAFGFFPVPASCMSPPFLQPLIVFLSRLPPNLYLQSYLLSHAQVPRYLDMTWSHHFKPHMSKQIISFTFKLGPISK